MSINWFEGGRRITKLLIAITSLIGAYVLCFEYDRPPVEFSTSSPLDAWHLYLESEDGPEVGERPANECFPAETLWSYEIKPGLVRDINLCFVSGDKTEAEIASDLAKQVKFDLIGARRAGYTDAEIADYLYTQFRLDNETNRLKAVEAAVSRARVAGETQDVDVLMAEVARLKASIGATKELLKGENTLVSQEDGWEQGRVADFEITPKMLAVIEKELPRIEREAFFEHAKEVLSTAAYFIGGFWIFSFVIGWIIRGFAGVPRGQDFKPKSTATVD